MKKKLLVVAALLGGSFAGAQTASWSDANGTFKFLGCYTNKDAIWCDLTYLLMKGDSSQLNGDRQNLQYFTADGATGTAYSISVGGSDFNYSRSAKVVSGIPSKIIYSISLPNSITSLPAIIIDGHRINNVFISKTGAPAMPPVASAPAPRPVVPSPTPNAAVTGFNIQLTNCKVNAGVYTCTATLTPR